MCKPLMTVWFSCHNTQMVSQWQKPLQLITHLLRLHGCPTDKWDKFVLDVGCGSGSTSLGALFCGMSAIAFDMDPHCVGGTQARLRNWNEKGLSEDQFTVDEFLKRSKKKEARKRKRAGKDDTADTDDDSDAEDDEADEDVEKEAPALDPDEVRRIVNGEVVNEVNEEDEDEVNEEIEEDQKEEVLHLNQLGGNGTPRRSARHLPTPGPTPGSARAKLRLIEAEAEVEAEPEAEAE